MRFCQEHLSACFAAYLGRMRSDVLFLAVYSVGVAMSTPSNETKVGDGNQCSTAADCETYELCVEIKYDLGTMARLFVHRHCSSAHANLELIIFTSLISFQFWLQPVHRLLQLHLRMPLLEH